MTGAEYLTAPVLAGLWRETDRAFDAELAEAGVAVQDFLKAPPSCLEPGRPRPFQPCREQEGRRGARSRSSRPIRRGCRRRRRRSTCRSAGSCRSMPARKQCERLLSLLTAGAAGRRARALAEGHGRCRRDLSSAALDARSRPCSSSRTCRRSRRPAWSCACRRRGACNRPPRPQVTATVGGKAPGELGHDALLDFRMEVTLDGEALTAAEISELLAQSDGLALVRGRWVEIDRERLAAARALRAVERAAAASGLAFGEAMRLLAGADVAGRGAAAAAPTPTGRRRRRSLAGRDAGRPAQPGGRWRKSIPAGAARHAAALSAGRACAGFICSTQLGPGRLPRRRHGTRQDHPGAFAAAGAEARR